MKNAHRLSLMVLTVLTAAFLVVDLPLMAQMGGQQRRGQQGAPQKQKGAQQGTPQKQKGAQQGAPRGAGQAQIGKPPDPKLSPPQERRVKQLQGQAQSLFRNLQRVVGELQRLPKRGTQGFDVGPVNNPNPRGPQQKPGPPKGTQKVDIGPIDPPKPGKQGIGSDTDSGPFLDDPKKKGYNPGKGASIQNFPNAGRNDAAYIKTADLKKQARQIVNNLEGIGNELKGLGFTKQNFTILQSGASTFAPQQLEQMGKELKDFGIAVPAFFKLLGL